MLEWQERTRRLLGSHQLETLASAHVLVVGLGGVGSAAAESLARAGVGELTLVDGDDICISNINRKLPALHSTVGLRKVEVVALLTAVFAAVDKALSCAYSQLLLAPACFSEIGFLPKS